MIDGQDAAYADNIDSNYTGVIGGYLVSDYAYHPWSTSDWGRFPHNRKLPYYVASSHARSDAHSAVKQLQALGVPKGAPVGLDLETRVNVRYVNIFFGIVRRAGYKILAYGSESTIFQNPACNGRIVALYDGSQDFPANWGGKAVRGKQYQAGDKVDLDIYRDWVVREFWK
jgi:hypothetical protein